MPVCGSVTPQSAPTSRILPAGRWQSAMVCGGADCKQLTLQTGPGEVSSDDRYGSPDTLRSIAAVDGVPTDYVCRIEVV